MKVELTRYRVKAAKTSKVKEWMDFLNDHMEDVLITLEGGRCMWKQFFTNI